MRTSRVACFTCTAFAVLICTAAPAAGASPGARGYTLATTKAGRGYAPTFTGNGWLGVRVPATGQGYAGGTVPAQSELAGFYAKPTKPKNRSEAVQQRANLPTWSTLVFGDGVKTFGVRSGQMSGWRQTLDLHTGVITTSATWTSRDGNSARFVYRVFTDRANQHVGVVRLTLTPHWTGAATVSDEIDGGPAAMTNETSRGFSAALRQDYVAVTTQTTAIEAALASTLHVSGQTTLAPVQVDSKGRSVGQRVTFPVRSGHTYTVTKYVGVDDSQNAGNPVAAAQAESTSAAAAGYGAALGANNRAWAALWAGRIDVLGNPSLAKDVNASQFYLWSNTRAGVDWSISPAGLSSNGYDGHIFWDAETWMYPSLLAQHPDLAAGMDAYRFDRLAQAEQHAMVTGHAGARYPWESALDGTEQIPPPVSVNSEGLYEQHITADIALAQWEYYVATGDRSWLANQGWPVISEAATFWASRAVRGADGRYHIHHVTDPDEENPNVSDGAFTNAGARAALQNAVKAAHILGLNVPASWSRIAAGLGVPVNARLRIHPEYSGYRGQLVKQADVTLLQYPWAYPMSHRTAQNDLNYYVPRTDPAGPSMSDAVNSIDTSALGSPGCSSFVYTQRSYQPFIRDVFDQFSETSTGGAFTFMTGIGGFLQEFLYGYTGLRFTPGYVAFRPSLSGGFGGVVLHRVRWHGRTFSVTVGRRRSRLTLSAGGSLPVLTRSGRRVVRVGGTLVVATARPDLARTGDRVRCGAARASSSAPGSPPLAAVDGSPATPWEPASLPATITLPVRGGSVRQAAITWGRQWPAQPKPNVHPAPGPVLARRATRYSFLVSADGRTWKRLFTVVGQAGTSERLRFPAQRVRFVRLAIASATLHEPPLLEELRLTG